MRLFTGISIAPHVIEALEEVLAPLRREFSVNWSPAANLHITTKFIGEWPDSRLHELEAALGTVPPFAPFPVSMAGFGFYPGPKRARVLYAGVDGGQALPALARSIDDTLSGIGCAAETRPYSPHLTLARSRNENIGELVPRITSMESTHFGSFITDEFHLFMSKAGGRTSVYTTLATFPAAAAESAA